VRRPDRRQLVTLGGYAAAAAVYVAIGVTVTDWLLSVFVAMAYLLFVVWLVPTVVRWLL
jgi:hypothetical protein